MLPATFNFESTIPLWRLDSGGKKIIREFTFLDFAQAFEFMTRCAQYAEQINHHPDWSNSWNKVMVHLSTHSCNAITDLDIELAKAMDLFAAQVTSNH